MNIIDILKSTASGRVRLRELNRGSEFDEGRNEVRYRTREAYLDDLLQAGFVETGECRPPKSGEWYFDHYVGRARQSWFDHEFEAFQILKCTRVGVVGV